MPDDLVFRDANPSEDDELARILYNAFLPIWNHNWFQCLTAPLAAISSTSSPLTPPQSRRLAFYRSWIALNRAHNGDVIVAHSPTSTGQPSAIAAVVLLLPPHARPTWFEPLLAWRTGLIPSLIGFGAQGMWRICWTFEGNVERMIAEGLKGLGIGGTQETLLFCQGCVRNPEWKGEKGPARKLLDWGIKRWWKKERSIPVWLDCTTDEGVRAYEEIGFKLVGECLVKTGTDEKGILMETPSEEEKEDGRRVARQRVMVRMPEV